MSSDSTILGVIIAVIGTIGSVLVARISAPRAHRTDAPEVLALAPGEELSVSPEIWRDLSGRITELDAKVSHLTEVVERQTQQVGFLERLLRTAVRIIRRQQVTLRRAGLPEEPIPAILMPYGD